MVYRRRFVRKRRYGKKKSYRKRFTRYSKGLGSSGKRFFKLSFVTNAASDAGGILDDVYTTNPSGLGDWSSVAALFDMYKVCAMKVKYIPSLPNDSSVTTGYWPMYIVGDNNEVTALSTAQSALNYEACKVKNMYRPWSYYFKFMRVSEYGTGSSEVTMSGGWRPTTVTTGVQSIKMYCTGLDTSTIYGSFVISAYIVCKNRK